MSGATLTHADLEPGMELEVCIGGSPHTGAWALARVLKSYSHGAQVRVLDGKSKGREIAVKFPRLRLLANGKTTGPAEPIVKPSASKARGASANPSDVTLTRPGEDIDDSVAAWLEMGRDLVRPLEERKAALDAEVEFYSAQLVELEELRAHAAKERADVDTRLSKLRKIVGGRA